MTEPTPLKVKGDYSNLIIKKEIDGYIVEYVGIDEMNEDQIEKYCRDTGTKRAPVPQVLNKHRTSVLPPNAVYCGRGSPYGNPFVIGRDGDRDEVCDKFEREVLPTLNVAALRGKNLLCFCAPKRCHCDAILRKANEE